MLREDLFKSFSEEQFVVNYQLQWHLKNQRFIGVEALIRWNNSLLGGQTPECFLYAIQEMGSIEEFDLLVFKKVLKEVPLMHEKIKDLEKIAINISANSLCSRAFVDKVGELYGQYEKYFNQIEVELIEQFKVTNFNLAQLHIEQLKNYGLKIAIDDFGKGFSNIEALNSLKFNTLKIDKVFLKDVYKDKKKQELLENVIKMGKNLGLEIVAEGIENEAEYNYIKNTECDIIQGYFLAKPCSIEQLGGYIDKVGIQGQLRRNDNK